MTFRIFILSMLLLGAVSVLAQKTNTLIPTENDEIKIEDEIDSLEIAHEEIFSPADELYKNLWNCTNIKYPGINFIDRNDTLIIALIGIDDKPYVHPHPGKVISKYGPRSGRMHTGTDIKLQSGDPVLCAFDGKVRLAKRFSGYGNLVLVRHNNGLETIYAHLKSISVKVGDQVSAGELIGLGGRTGRATTDHLHFETRIFGEPFDSEKYIDFESQILKVDQVYYKNKLVTTTLDRLKPDILLNTPIAQTAINNDKKLVESKSSTPDKATTATNAESVKHVIKKGDNLWNISQRYNTTVKSICEANKISPRQTLRVGTALIIR
jgi:LysM repeat protein